MRPLKGLPLNYIDDEADAMVVVLTMMMMLMMIP